MSDIDLTLDSDESTDVLRAHASVAREAPKLATGRHPISLLGLLLCGIVAITAGGYLGHLTETGFSLTRIDPFLSSAIDPRPGAGDVVELPLFEQLMVEGARNYASCVGCHSADGGGQAAAGIPPLAGAEWVTGSDERLALILLHGIGGPIEVAGKLYNNPAMQVSIAGGMTDRQIASIMTYIRNSWGNSAPLVTAEGVAYAREKHAGRSSFWTAAELLEEIPDGSSLPGGALTEEDGGDAIPDETSSADEGAEGDAADPEIEETTVGDEASLGTPNLGAPLFAGTDVSRLESLIMMGYVRGGVSSPAGALDEMGETEAEWQTGEVLLTYREVKLPR
jgi:mono/diheme cytochrome c family protein